MSKIMVVDDNPGDREILVTLLQLKGYTVIEARRAEEALELLHTNRPDLIITDVCMFGMNGLQMVERVKANPAIAAIPIIFYTALYDEPKTREAIRAHGCLVLAKPISIKDIISKIDEMLRSTPGSNGTRGDGH